VLERHLPEWPVRLIPIEGSQGREEHRFFFALMMVVPEAPEEIEEFVDVRGCRHSVLAGLMSHRLQHINRSKDKSVFLNQVIRTIQCHFVLLLAFVAGGPLTISQNFGPDCRLLHHFVSATPLKPTGKGSHLLWIERWPIHIAPPFSTSFPEMAIVIPS